MKKQIVLAAIGILSIIQVWATGKDKDKVMVKEVKLTAGFEKLTISNGVDVLLIEDASQTVSIQGTQKYIDAITIEEKDGHLFIGSKKNGFTNKAVVYLPVQQLKQIQLNDDTRVYSVGSLNSPELTVTVSGNCDFGIDNKGKVKIAHKADCEVAYKWVDNRIMVEEVIL